MNKEVVQKLWDVFADKTPKQCFDLCVSSLSLEFNQLDRIIIQFAKYFQRWDEDYNFEDEIPFPMTDDNTHLG